MKTLVYSLLAATAILTAWAETPTPSSPPAKEPATAYTCPMHPDVKAGAPGKCPKCGMDLVPAGQNFQMPHGCCGM